MVRVNVAENDKNIPHMRRELDEKIKRSILIIGSLRRDIINDRSSIAAGTDGMSVAI